MPSLKKKTHRYRQHNGQKNKNSLRKKEQDASRRIVLIKGSYHDGYCLNIFNIFIFFLISSVCTRIYNLLKEAVARRSVRPRSAYRILFYPGPPAPHSATSFQPV